MRKLKLWVACAMAAAMLALTACGKEDKLVLVTTEAAASQSDATTTEDILADIREEAENTTEEEKKREPASEEDKKVTMEAIYDANKGDTLLAGGNNYSLNTIYYSDGVEVYSEYQFLGFAEDGTYLQAYEDSNGIVQVLDKEYGYWYLIDEDKTCYALIYPEPNVADAIINTNQNVLINSLTEADQTIKDIYREDGDLVVETNYKNDNASYVFQYVLDDNAGTVVKSEKPAKMTADKGEDYVTVHGTAPDGYTLVSAAEQYVTFVANGSATVKFTVTTTTP